MDKLQENIYKLANKLELMKYAILGLTEENGEAYFLEDLQKEILKDFYDIQDEIDKISIRNYLKQNELT